MNDMKCPICGNILERYDNGLVCYRHCLNGKNVWGSEETLKELICTRKALGVAVDALKIIGSGKVIEHSVMFHEDDNKIFIANKALEQIIALEQKDVK